MPSDHDATDYDLLARLNALRPSPVTLTQPSNASLTRDKRSDPDLPSRFAKLSAASRDNSEKPRANALSDVQSDPEVDESHNEEDDRTIEELLADLGPEDTWRLEDGEEERAKSLMREAEEALRKSPKEQRSATAKDTQEGNPTVAEETTKQTEEEKPEAAHDGEEPALTEEQEADEIIQRFMAEASLEERDELAAAGEEHHVRGEAAQQGVSSRSDPESGEDHNDGIEDAHNDDEDLVDLPAAPTALPVSDLPGNETSLPSTPSDLPSRFGPTVPSNKPGLPKYTDEEIETWCIICNTDATVRCLGCEGDLYCGNCWNEGHRGPDAGYEERRHKAVAFVKPGAERKKKTKTAARRVAV